jgi:hypothetical protein
VYADEMPFKKLQDIWEFKDPPWPSYPDRGRPEGTSASFRADPGIHSARAELYRGRHYLGHRTKWLRDTPH